MSLQDELLKNEKRLWMEGPDAYRKHISPKCLIAFPAMAGVMTNETVARTVADGPRWNEPEIEVEGLLSLTPEIAILTYRARATMDGRDPYSAIVSSGYEKQDDGWKLFFHQQTPSR
jgi:hypothetical protein